MTLAFALLAATLVQGAVFDDANGNGRRDPGERGLLGVAVSDGNEVVVTGADGLYRLEATGRNVFVVVTGDRRSTSPWHHKVAAAVDFALAPSPAPASWRFAHLSDTHVHPGNVERMRRALALARDQHAEFAVVTGDLNRDALRVDEATARARMDLYAREAAAAPLPVRSLPGNHDIFGIERHLSLVPATNPAYGKALYEELLGPRYYSWNRGPLHFVALDTLGIDDLWYYGAIEADELAWLQKDLALLPPGTPVVTAGHVPFRTGAFTDGYETEGPGRTLITVKGVTFYRHVVRNTAELAGLLKPFAWTLALQGHTHEGERLRLFDGGITRYHTAPAVDHPEEGALPSGFFVYTARGATIDDGELVPLGDH